MIIRILIADDKEIARAHLTESIRDHDEWQVCGQAENGQEAVLKAVELKPDIVILDLAMPVMNGLSAAREIGKALPSVPIVLFTVHKLAALDLEAKKAGVRHVVGKLDTDALLSTIEELVKKESPE